MASWKAIQRHRTAIRRSELSKPIRLALEARLVNPDVRVLDYGCGKGDDVRQLQAMGISVDGWDPVHRPRGRLTPADIVNLGYVVNVIEDPAERTGTLQAAWQLAHQLLIVSSRLTLDAPDGSYERFGDGWITKRKTFQKFFTQRELRDWIDQTLGVQSVAAAPGVFFVFRDDGLRQAYIAAMGQRQRSAPRPRKSDILFEEHHELLEALMEFVANQGRLPADWELSSAGELKAVFGSLRRAFFVVRRVT